MGFPQRAPWGSRSNGTINNDPLEVILLAAFYSTVAKITLWRQSRPEKVWKKTETPGKIQQ
jgi:hypothetical protein